MAINNKLEYTVLDLIESSARYAKTRPLNLGGVSGPGGGVGLPPGGFIGQLPQIYVAYDEDEIASSGTPASGMSLLDNLNHIRYRLNIIESGGSIWVVDDNTATTYPDIDTIHFSGAGVTVTDLGSGDLRVSITATGSGGSMPSPFALPNDITPASFSTTQHNYNPTGLDTADVVRLTSVGNNTITGLAGGSDGRIIILQNIGSGIINLASNSSSSSPSNQFEIVAEAHTLVSGSSVILKYDSTLSKWKIIGGDSVAIIQGVPIESSLRTGIEDGNILAYDNTTGHLIARSSLSVYESDGSPIVSPAWAIAFSGATVTDLGFGTALVTISGGQMPSPFALPNDITPPALTGDNHNYSPTGINTADVLRLTASGGSGAMITGITGGIDGRILILQNIGTEPILLSHEDVASTVGNRLVLGETSLELDRDTAAILQYDSTVSGWRGIGLNTNSIQGVPVDSAIQNTLTEGGTLVYDSAFGMFTSGDGGVTIASGDARYLKLDTSNDPLTDQLRIISMTPGNGGLYIESYGDSYAADFEAFTVNDNVPSNTVFIYRETTGSGNITGAMIEGWQYDGTPGVISGPWILFEHEGNERFKITVSGGVYIPSGQFYNIDGVPHSHDFRTKITANRTYYVRTDGSNNNNGLTNTAGGAFLTIQKAIDVIAGIDLSIYTVTIQVADGTYTGTIRITNPFIGGSVVLQGNSSTPANVVISVSSDDAIKITCPTVITLKDFKITTTVSGALGHGIVIDNGGSVIYSNLNFGAIGLDGFSVISGTVQCTGNYTISGSARRHFSIFNGVFRIQGFTVTLSGTPDFSSRFCHLLGPAIAYLDGNTFSGSATGQRYFVGNNANIYTAAAGETYLPGNSAGTRQSGGRYDQTPTYLQAIVTNVVLGTSTVPASSTSYGYPGVGSLGGISGTIWPVGGTLKNMYIRLSGTQPASGSLVITLQKNLADTSIVVTFAAGAGPSVTGSDTTHTATIVAGDILTWKVVNNATATSGALSTFSISLETDMP